MIKKISFLWLLAILVVAGCSQSNSANQKGVNNTSAAPQLKKFSEQPYAGNAYLISVETLSPEAEKAISGFQMSKQNMPDGATEITLKALEPQYHDQKYLLHPGDQLYFIDKFMADDLNGAEKNIKDDTAVIVNDQSDVVQEPADWSNN